MALTTGVRVKNMIKNALDNLMSNALPRIHDYDKLAFMMNDIIISDMDDISITYDGGGSTKSFGTNGDVGYNLNPLLSGTIKIKMPTMSRYRRMIQSMIEESSIYTFDIKIINMNRGCDDIVFYGCMLGQKQNDNMGDFVPYTTFSINFANVKVLRILNEAREGQEGWF